MLVSGVFDAFVDEARTTSVENLAKVTVIRHADTLTAPVALDVCRSCEKECRKHEKEHEQCKNCAEACGACLKECLRFAA
jgi:hypothetical protein